MSLTLSEMGFENPILKGTFIELGVFITVNFSNLIYFQAKRYNYIFKRLTVSIYYNRDGHKQIREKRGKKTKFVVFCSSPPP